MDDFASFGEQLGDKTSWGNENEAVSVMYPLPVEKADRYALKGIVPHLFNLPDPPIVELVIRSGGREFRVEWNQYAGSGFWRDLGMFELEPGATLELRRSRSCRCKSVVADGFAIVPGK